MKTIKIGATTLNLSQIAMVSDVSRAVSAHGMLYEFTVTFSGGAEFTYFYEETVCGLQHSRLLKAMDYDELESTVVTEY